MKFKHVMLALAATIMMASCGQKKEGDAKAETTESTEAAAEAPKTEEASKAEPKDLIAKAWMIDDMDASAMIAKLPKEEQEKMKKSMEENKSKIKGNMIFDFKADGKVTNIIKDGKQEIKSDGTWTLSDDGKTLTTIDDKGKKSEVNVLKLTEDALELQPIQEGMDMVMKFVPKK